VAVKIKNRFLLSIGMIQLRSSFAVKEKIFSQKALHNNASFKNADTLMGPLPQIIPQQTGEYTRFFGKRRKNVKNPSFFARILWKKTVDSLEFDIIVCYNIPASLRKVPGAIFMRHMFSGGKPV
jgi:hypothetical protein